MSNPLDNDDLDEFEYVTESDFEEDIFSQLDQEGQPLGEPSVALRNDSLAAGSDMSVDRSSIADVRVSGNRSGVNVVPSNPLVRQPHYHYGIRADEPQEEMRIDQLQAVLDRISNSPQEFEVPARGLDERAIPLGNLSQESFSSGMNLDSPAGSQAGVNVYSVPIQFPPSLPNSQSSEVGDEGLGSLSQDINRTVPQWTRDQLELPSSQESL